MLLLLLQGEMKYPDHDTKDDTKKWQQRIDALEGRIAFLKTKKKK